MKDRVSFLLVVSALLPGDLRAAEEPVATVTRSYEVSSLLEAGHEARFSLEPLRPLVVTQPVPGEAVTVSVMDLGMEEVEKRSRDVSREMLIELVSRQLRYYFETHDDYRSIRRSTDVGLQGRLLQVRAPEEGHGVVERLVKALNWWAGVQIRIECLLTSREVLDSVAPQWRDRGPYLPEDVFDQALDANESRLFSLVARNGHVAVAGAESSAIMPRRRGTAVDSMGHRRLEVRPVVIPGKDAVRLDLTLGRTWSSGGDPSGSAAAQGEWIRDETLYSLCALVKGGATLAAAGVVGGVWNAAPDDRLSDPQAVLLRIRTASPERVDTRTVFGDDRVWQIHDVAALVAERPRIWPRGTFRPRVRCEDPEAVIEGLLRQTGGDRLWGELQTVEYHDGRLHIVAPEVVQVEINRRIAVLVSHATEPVAVDLRIIDTTREILSAIRRSSDREGVLEPGWDVQLTSSETVRENRFSISALANEPSGLRRASTFERPRPSGDNDASSLERGFTEGVELQLLVGLLPDDRRAHLQAQLIETSVRGHRFVPAAQEVRRWRIDQWVPLEREVILRSDLASRQRATVLVGRVRAVP